MTFGLLSRLRARGVGLTSVTHAAGISSTGSDALDERLRLPERYLSSEVAVHAIHGTRATDGRVVAVGTTVVRALEASAAARRRTARGR